MARMPSREGILRALSLISKVKREISSPSGFNHVLLKMCRYLVSIDPSKTAGGVPVNSP